MNNELMRKYINILEDSSNSNLSTMWATYAVNSCILGNLGKAGATGEEDGPDYRAENERLLGMVSSNAGAELADKLKKWSDYLCKRVHLKRGPSFEALFKALPQWGVDANHVYDQLDAVIDLQGATRTWGGQANKAPGRPSAYGVQEGSESDTVSFREMVNVVDKHYPKYYAELSGSNISDKQFEQKIINAYKKIMQKQGVAEAVPNSTMVFDRRATTEYALEMKKALIDKTSAPVSLFYNKDNSITLIVNPYDSSDPDAKGYSGDPYGNDGASIKNVTSAIDPYYRMFRQKGWRFDQPIQGRITFGVPVKQQGVAEGSFGAKYHEKLAQKVFDLNPTFSTSGRADELVSAGYAAAKDDLGQRASGTFRSDDFVSDFVNSYSYLQNQGKGSHNY